MERRAFWLSAMMARSGKLGLWCLLGAWVVTSCGEDEIQSQFYDYQIERLLSAGDTAIWRPLAISGEGFGLDDCQDSVFLFIAQLADDSLDIRELLPSCDGQSAFDTISLGKAKASVAEDIFFTDSIVFASGRFWIITESFSLTFAYREEDVNYRYLLVE